jgi:hypothetical protein
MHANLIAHSWAEEMYRQRLQEEIAKARLTQEVAATGSRCHRVEPTRATAETVAALRSHVQSLSAPWKIRSFATRTGAAV